MAQCSSSGVRSWAGPGGGLVAPVPSPLSAKVEARILMTVTFYGTRMNLILWVPVRIRLITDERILLFQQRKCPVTCMHGHRKISEFIGTFPMRFRHPSNRGVSGTLLSSRRTGLALGRCPAAIGRPKLCFRGSLTRACACHYTESRGGATGGGAKKPCNLRCLRFTNVFTCTRWDMPVSLIFRDLRDSILLHS